MNLHFLSVDRIEKDYLVCENQDEKVKIIPFEKLSEDISEGTVIYVDNSGNIRIDKEKTQIRRDIIQKLQNQVE